MEINASCSNCFVGSQSFGFLSLGFSAFLSFLSLLHPHEQAIKEMAFFRGTCVNGLVSNEICDTNVLYLHGSQMWRDARGYQTADLMSIINWALSIFNI